MASIRPRRTTTGTAYDLRFRIAGQSRTRTFDSPSGAEKWRRVFEAMGPAAALAMLDAAEDAAPDVPTVDQLVDQHIAALSGITEGTRGSYYREARRDVTSRLGSLVVSGVTPDVVAEWVNWLARQGGARGQGLAGKTIANRHGLLSAALQRAVPAWLPANPCVGVRLPKTRRRPPVFLSPAAAAVLLAHIDPRYRGLVLVIVATGLRWSEVTALQVDHVRVDPATAHIEIVQAWKDVDSGPMELGPPKSPRSWRTVPVPAGSPAYEVLASATRGRRGDAWLFSTPRGCVIRNGTFHQRTWGPLMRRLALEQGWTRRPSVHDLRHTAVSIMLAGGATIHAVSQLIGHERESLTWDVYGHLAPGHKEVAMDLLGSALASALAAGQAAEPGAGLRVVR